MSKTVVGLFQNTTQAEDVRREFINRGFRADDLVVASEEGSRTTSTETSNTPGAGAGFGVTIGNFFRSLTGNGESEHVEAVRRGGAILIVTVAEGEEGRAVNLLQSHGAEKVAERQTGADDSVISSLPLESEEIFADTTIPIVREEMTVGKRQVLRGGMRVSSHLRETSVEESVQLREGRIRIDRVPVGRPATEADFVAFQEGTIELNETAEEAVVSKRAWVVEEIVIAKEFSERTQIIHDTLRHTEVRTEQIIPDPSDTSALLLDDGSLRHLDGKYASSGKA